MKTKIDKIPVEMFRTVHKKDALGNRVKDRETYMGYRKIKCVETGPRIGHFLVDMICFEIIYQSVLFGIGVMSALVGKNQISLLTLGYIGSMTGLLLYPAYYFLFELMLQRTPGKYLTKTIVVNEYGDKPETGTLLLRTIIRLVPFEALSCFSDTNRGWHDRWSNTYVMTTKELAEIKALQEKQDAKVI